MSELEIPTAKVFEPLLAAKRYKGAYGGRGSGKSHFFAGLLVEEHIANPGMRSVCIREYLKSLKQSAKQLIEDKIQSMGVGKLFDIQKDKIICPGNGFIIFEGMQDHNAESIKSLEGADRCWVEEAQTLSERSLMLLRPTIRKDNAEIWFSWNPRHDKDAVDEFLRVGKADATVVKANWRDNPWFPAVLEAERQLDLKDYPERYDHIWEGGYAKALAGAYFAQGLNQARLEQRIGKLSLDPILPTRAFWDIGGSGANADAMAIWIVQFVGQSIHVLDYIEGVGQVLGYYTAQLRDGGWEKAKCFLPHDGINSNSITGKRYEDHVREAGFDVTTVPNQGAGAAMMRIEAVRRLFPRIWFNEDKVKRGMTCLGYYHEKRNATGHGQGPEHDWSSHAADAFGLMAICYNDPARQKSFNRRIEYPNYGYA